MRREERREDGEEEKRKQAGGEMKRDKRWVRTQKIASMKESDKQTRQSVRAENRRLGLDVLHQPPQALKSDYHRPTKTPTPAIISVTFCEVKTGKRRRYGTERERWRGGEERCGGRGAEESWIQRRETETSLSNETGWWAQLEHNKLILQWLGISSH